MIVLFIISLGVFLASGTKGPAQTLKQPSQERQVIWGQLLARDNCARCHATDIEGESPHKKAPPFWEMSTRRDVDTIADMLVNQASPKHSDMPKFRITRTQAQYLAEWIAWLQPVAHGKRLVEANCSRCHAIDRNDNSNHPDAPAFRTLSKFYPIDALEESFAEGIVTGHPDMPIFQMTEVQLIDVITYLETIQNTPASE